MCVEFLIQCNQHEWQFKIWKLLKITFLCLDIHVHLQSCTEYMYILRMWKYHLFYSWSNESVKTKTTNNIHVLMYMYTCTVCTVQWCTCISIWKNNFHLLYSHTKTFLFRSVHQTSNWLSSLASSGSYFWLSSPVWEVVKWVRSVWNGFLNIKRDNDSWFPKIMIIFVN